MQRLISKIKEKVVRRVKRTRGQSQLHVPDQIYPDDVFIVSYPKSGNTWVRFLLSNLLKRPDEEINFHTVHEHIPEVGKHEKGERPTERPRLLKSHSTYESSYPRVIYIVRDGRDVYVSYYHYKRGKLNEETTFEQFLRRTDLRPCTWSEHVDSWLARVSPPPELLLVRYEDLLADCAKQLRRMASFVGLDASTIQINAAVEASSFQNMRSVELEKGRAFQEKDQADLFTRKGTSGDWRNYFGPVEKTYFKRKEGKTLIRLGYEPNNQW